MKNVIKLYCRDGFTIQTALMDGEFGKIKMKVLDQVAVNNTVENEHVGEFERKIHHIKERYRCIKRDMDYTIMPNIMIKTIVSHTVMFANAFPDKQGTSQ